MYLSYRQVAERLGVSVPTVKRYSAAGKLPVIKLSARTVRVDSAVLDVMLAGLQVGGMSRPADGGRA